MSTLRITMATQAIDFDPATRGSIIVRFNDGNRDYDLALELTQGISTTGRFTEVAWIDGNSGEDLEQVTNYRNAWNRDHSGVGLPDSLVGIQRSNISASIDGDDVLLTAINGVFDQASCQYTGNVLSGVTFTANNTPQDLPLVMIINTDSTGDCTNADHSIVASGGTPPYTLTINGIDVLTGWDGSETIQPLPRGTNPTVTLTDGVLDTVTRTPRSPRAILPSDFSVTQNQVIGSTDLVVNTDVPVANTGPLVYALEPQGTASGQTWFADNTFTGIFAGVYELFIRDYFGCSVKKTIIVSEISDPSMAAPPSYFEVMNGNSVLFSEAVQFSKDIKKNFDNTLSYNELSPIRYNVKEYFDPSDEIAVQYKSSYPFHVVTKHNCDGTKADINPVMIQENLGVVEKVDCTLFPIEGGGTGVYFVGGNEYVPDTDTVLGASEHTVFLPYWAAEGQIVTVEGLGTQVIQGFGYNDVVDRDYFILLPTISAETQSKVQVTYNKQIYNLFEFRFSVSDGESSRIVIEKGESFEEIVGNPWTSELIVGQQDIDDNLLIQWSDIKNKGGIVFQSGIEFLRRMVGKFRPSFRGNSDTADTDTRAYSLNQTAYLEYVLELEGLSAKEAYQMCIATGLEGFRVNGVPLVRSEFPQIETLGSSNLYNLSCRMSTGGDNLSIQSDEIVLNPSTGEEGGGSGINPPYTLPLYDSRVRVNSQGGFVTVDGSFVAVN